MIIARRADAIGINTRTPRTLSVVWGTAPPTGLRGGEINVVFHMHQVILEALFTHERIHFIPRVLSEGQLVFQRSLLRDGGKRVN